MNKTVLHIIGLSICFITNSYASDEIFSESTKAQSIYDKMSLDEKIGQLILPSYNLLMQGAGASATKCNADLHSNLVSDQIIILDCGLDQIRTYHLGAVLQGGGPLFPNLDPTAVNWARYNKLAASQRNKYDPVLLIGNDAVHMNMHVQGSVMGPHNIGLGATNDPKLIREIANLTAEDSLATGFNWVYAPTVAKVHDLRWGRAYEGFTTNSSVLQAMVMASVEGLQMVNKGKITGVLATAKHFIGDGTTQYGLDEGDDKFVGNEQEFWSHNGQGYEAAVDANVGSIMASYSAIDGDKTRMHFGGKWDILNKFKNSGIIGTNGKKYQFQGFVVSDWEGATRAAYFYKLATGESLSLAQTFAKSINGGVDMQMVAIGDTVNPFDPSSTPNYTNVGEVFTAIKSAYTSGLIPEAKLHDAVMRILKVKLAMAAKTPPLSQYPKIQARERVVALKAAEESLVLLKNRILPLNPEQIKNVVFIGNTNDIGVQNGGWSINWQGQKGNQFFMGKDQISSGATTVESAVITKLGKGINYYYVNSTKNTVPANIDGRSTLVINVMSEAPYAEYMGDIANSRTVDAWYNFGVKTNANLYLKLPQTKSTKLERMPLELKVLNQLKMINAKVVIVIYSGRPVVLDELSEDNINSAIIAAFLPGTLGGQAICNAIFGKYRFGKNIMSNKLPFPWPANTQNEQSFTYNDGLFRYGYGLID